MVHHGDGRPGFPLKTRRPGRSGSAPAIPGKGLDWFTFSRAKKGFRAVGRLVVNLVKRPGARGIWFQAGTRKLPRNFLGPRFGLGLPLVRFFPFYWLTQLTDWFPSFKPGPWREPGKFLFLPLNSNQIIWTSWTWVGLGFGFGLGHWKFKPWSWSSLVGPGGVVSLAWAWAWAGLAWAWGLGLGLAWAWAWAWGKPGLGKTGRLGQNLGALGLVFGLGLDFGFEF